MAGDPQPELTPTAAFPTIFPAMEVITIPLATCSPRAMVHSAALETRSEVKVRGALEVGLEWVVGLECRADMVDARGATRWLPRLIAIISGVIPDPDLVVSLMRALILMRSRAGTL